ncbi:MAG: hypothetical protein ACNS64_06710 [Candidatus Halalkalibacterium sp. M3_1C_030]
MPFEEFAIAIVAIVGGVGLAGFIFYNIFKLIRTWMSGSSSYDDETFERLARAFMQHKKDTEKRLQNLEAIVTEDDQSTSSSTKQIEEPRRTIEIDEEDENEEAKSSDGNLRNMLRE